MAQTTNFSITISAENKEIWPKFREIAEKKGRSPNWLLNQLIRLAVEQPGILNQKK